MDGINNVTALAELTDMVYTRATLALKDRRWHLELHPTSSEWITPHGELRIVAYVYGPQDKLKSVNYRIDIYAIDHGGQVPVDILDEMIEYHLKKFMERVEEVEAGAEPEPVIPPSWYQTKREWLESMRNQGLIGERSVAAALKDIEEAEKMKRVPPDVQSGYLKGGKYFTMDIEDKIRERLRNDEY